MQKMTKKRIYLDFAATTPVSAEVLKVMLPYFSGSFGNPESVHSFGQDGISVLDAARESLAGLLGTDFRGIVFTSGATESNNLLLLGALEAFEEKNPGITPKIIISPTEHASVHALAAELAKRGADVALPEIDRFGRVIPESVSKLLDARTTFVSVIHGNNETGAVNPISEIGKRIREFRKEGTFPLFHTDAAQTFPFLSVRLPDMHADAITISGHKMHGPKGVGALALSPLGRNIRPVFFGGEQEFSLRPGTSNVPLVAGLAEAARIAEKGRMKRSKEISKIREICFGEILKAFPAVKRNGEKDGFLPHILNVRFPGISAERMVLSLDMAGVGVSAGSACSARHSNVSRTVRIVWGDARARESVRFSFGEETKTTDIRFLSSVLKKLSAKK